MLDSVEGMDGGFRFDPTTSSILEELHDGNSIVLSTKSAHAIENPIFVIGNMLSSSLPSSMSTESITMKMEEKILFDGNQETSINMNGFRSRDSGFTKKAKQGDFEPLFTTQNSQPSSSVMTNSSQGSETVSTMNCSSSISQNSMAEAIYEEGVPKVTIKATYKEDTVRFKFEAAGGCSLLYEEIGKRFNLQTWQFQLRYVDDEDELVMLVSDSDLLECLEILEFMGKRNVKIMVRSLPSVSGSSSGSTCC